MALPPEAQDREHTRFVKAVCNAVRTQIRESSLWDAPVYLDKPPPADFAAEASVASTAFSGKLPAKLDHKDFQNDFYASIYLSCEILIRNGKELDEDFVCAALDMQGFGGRTRQAVRRLVYGEPYNAVDLEANAYKIREYARRRRALKQVDLLDAALRCTKTTEEDLRELLQKVNDVLGEEDGHR